MLEVVVLVHHNYGDELAETGVSSFGVPQLAALCFGAAVVWRIWPYAAERSRPTTTTTWEPDTQARI